MKLLTFRNQISTLEKKKDVRQTAKPKKGKG